MILALKLLFGAICAAMLTVTVRTSMEVSLWAAWPGYAANPWAIATLWDAYCGFLVFYVWVLYKERALGARILWFFLIMSLGNIATALYILIQLSRLKPGQDLESLLLRRPA
ncbi:MAG: DUF1475 family protein [Acidobacteria bacterium]|nr:DUF1475 family protein [Acidobacteriota bacterium]